MHFMYLFRADLKSLDLQNWCSELSDKSIFHGFLKVPELRYLKINAPVVRVLSSRNSFNFCVLRYNSTIKFYDLFRIYLWLFFTVYFLRRGGDTTCGARAQCRSIVEALFKSMLNSSPNLSFSMRFSL